MNLLLLFHDAKNWTHFSDSQLNTFLIQRIEHSFWTRLTELNSFFGMWLQELNPIFKILTQRIEFDSKNWTLFTKWHEELNPFLNMTHRNFSELQLKEFFSNKICLTKLKELNLLLTNDSKNWTFLKKKHDSQNWTIFPCDSRNWTLLSNMSHRNWTFLFYMTQWIEPFFFWIWLKELNFLFLEYDAKNWTFFLGYDAKIDPSLLNFDTNQKIEPSFQKRLKELNFLLEMCLKELHFFEKMIRRNDFSIDSKIELCKMTQIFQYDSKDWTFFQYDSKNWTFCLIQRIELFFFFDCDSKF